MKLFTSKKNANILKLAVSGVALLFVAAMVIVSNPIQMIVDSELTFRTGSLLYNVWQKPPLEVFVKVYVFNVTNLHAFRRGSDLKLKVAEVGPYVYQEFLEHRNVTFNNNNTVTYNPHRTVKFVRERSVGDPKLDRIVAPNIPYMGVTSAASEFSIFAAMAVNGLTKGLNSQAMLELSVHDYLWGYDDRLVNLASKFVPRLINFERFGLLERMFDEGHNVVTMALPSKSPVPHPESAAGKAARGFFIDNWNGVKGMKTWGYQEKANNTACNSLRGAFDGTLFPRNISKGEVFRVYRKAFCRTLPIVYSHPGVLDGIAAYNFKLPADAFDSDLQDPDSACFCKNNKCLKKGLGNITPCYYNIPLAISFPHFFNADATLLAQIEGLSPDEAKHGTEIAIQPQLGIPMRLHTRFQINLLMGDIKYNSEMQRFQNMVLPIFWLDIAIEGLTPGLMLLLKLLFNICPYVQLGLVITLLIAGISLLGSAMLLCRGLTAPWQRLNTTADAALVTSAIFPRRIKRAVPHQFSLEQPQEQKALLA